MSLLQSLPQCVCQWTRRGTKAYQPESCRGARVPSAFGRNLKSGSLNPSAAKRIKVRLRSDPSGASTCEKPRATRRGEGIRSSARVRISYPVELSCTKDRLAADRPLNAVRHNADLHQLHSAPETLPSPLCQRVPRM